MYKLANYWCNLTFVTFEGFYQHTHKLKTARILIKGKNTQQETWSLNIWEVPLTEIKMQNG